QSRRGAARHQAQDAGGASASDGPCRQAVVARARSLHPERGGTQPTARVNARRAVSRSHLVAGRGLRGYLSPAGLFLVRRCLARCRTLSLAADTLALLLPLQEFAEQCLALIRRRLHIGDALLLQEGRELCGSAGLRRIDTIGLANSLQHLF